MNRKPRVQFAALEAFAVSRGWDVFEPECIDVVVKKLWSSVIDPVLAAERAHRSDVVAIVVPSVSKYAPTLEVPKHFRVDTVWLLQDYTGRQAFLGLFLKPQPAPAPRRLARPAQRPPRLALEGERAVRRFAQWADHEVGG